jgi:hypothetical protein
VRIIRLDFTGKPLTGAIANQWFRSGSGTWSKLRPSKRKEEVSCMEDFDVLFLKGCRFLLLLFKFMSLK